MTFEPTPEQVLVRNAAKQTKDNLIIHALAGAAKTSTLVLIAKALANTPITCLAFNAKIAQEMKARLPGNCESLTLNSIGHRTWGDAIGRRLVIDVDKVYKIVSKLIETMPAGEERQAAYERMAWIIKAVRSGKTAGWVPDGLYDTANPLLSNAEFFAGLDEQASDVEEELILHATQVSLSEALVGNCDFDDQILMPTVFFGSFRARPLTMIDEAQDLSALNHVMLKKIVRGNRLIAVGDENQAIYGFRGAHSGSMALMRQSFQMRRFDLTISFRCPVKVVEEARSRAPAMQWPEWAKPGSVTRLTRWGEKDIPNDAVILCRNNSPLFGCAVKLLKAGRYPQIVGNDIVKGLVKIMNKLGPEDTSAEDALKLVDDWITSKSSVSREYAKVLDQASCMKIFIEQNRTLGDACAYAQHLMTMTGSIKLMTGHKSKGLEFPLVFILDRWLIDKESEQDLNLLYVMQTRAQEALAYIDSEHFMA